MADEAKVKAGDKVRFVPGPRSSGPMTGTVEKVESNGKTGKGNATFATVRCDDGKVRKTRPGGCTVI